MAGVGVAGWCQQGGRQASSQGARPRASASSRGRGLAAAAAGALADRYGGKGVLTAGVAAWSVCTILTPPTAYLGIPALVAMR